MAPIVEVNQLMKKYGSFTAVENVSFHIDQGEIFSLLGPNGAGKTTTISMLSTLLAPTSGDATICGYAVRSQAMQVRKCIGVVPQEVALYETLTADENLVFWGRMYGMSGEELKRRTEQVLKQVGLTERAGHKVQTFSGGMKRRLNIGVGLLHAPQVIFMDEPTVGIDPQSRRNILDTVKELNRQGMTVLYTTHYMEEAQEISDRVGVIDHGQMIACGTQKELTHLVGEHETLRLHIGEEEDTASLADAFRNIPGVLQSSGSDHQVVLMILDAEEMLAPVISRANELKVKIHSVDIQEPNLEAVFLHLTGRALRDE